MSAQQSLTTLAALLLCTSASHAAQTLRYDGLQNSSLGSAQIAVGANDALVVSNIGSSGLDGVRIELGEGQGVSFDPALRLGRNGHCELGAEVRRVGSAQVHPVSITIEPDSSGAAAIYTPDYSSLGLQTYTLRAMQAGQLVYEQGGHTGGTKMQQGGGVNSLPQKAYMLTNPFGPWGGAFLACFSGGGGITVTPPGGVPLAADFVEFISDPSQLIGMEAAEIRASGIYGSLTLEHESLRYRNLWTTGLDGGQLDALPSGILKVSNLGSSGCDGVSIDLPDDTGEAHGELAELATMAHPSGEVRLDSHCSTGEIDRLRCRATAGEWQFTPDFSAMGASTYTLELHQQGQMIFSQSGMSGPAVSTAAWSLFYKKTTEHADGSVTTEWCIGGNASSAHSVAGGPTMQADMFTVRSAPISVGDADVAALNLRAGNMTADLELLAFAASPPCVGTSYCIAATNSTGAGAMMCSTGSSSVADNDLTLTCSGLPANQFGLFFYGTNTGSIPLGNGYLCVSGQLFRIAITASDAGGMTSYALDNTAPPEPAGQISAGQNWHFQYWYRDAAGGGAGYNLSNGHTVLFTP